MVPPKTGSTSTVSPRGNTEAGKTGQANELEQQQLQTSSDIEGQVSSPVNEDAFGSEEGAEIQYKTCSWWQVTD
jgi:hypothetical protein